MNRMELIESAARRAHRVYRRIPGCILDRDDFRQIGKISLWLMDDRLPGMKSGMLYTILIRRMLDYGRRCLGMSRRAAAEGSVNLESLETWIETHDIVDGGQSALERLIEAEDEDIAAHLQTLLFCPHVCLTARQISALQLYYVEGLTVEDIGERCGITGRAISFHLAHGIQRMRNYLETAA